MGFEDPAFSLFIILLSVLVLSLLYGKYKNKEGNSAEENSDKVTEDDTDMNDDEEDEEDAEEVDIDELRQKVVNEIDVELKKIDPIISRYLYAKWNFDDDDSIDILEDYFEIYNQLKYGKKSISDKDTSE